MPEACRPSRPLAGIKVLELGARIAGPFCAKILAQFGADLHYVEREMIRQIRLADSATLKVPGVVPKLSPTPGDFDGGGPTLGEHTGEVLMDLGYDATAIADLRRRGVI
jgi:crotonobetainyl-CoA:carnitine CoA-transferase CaiB-like acyl-CoA transferase